MKTMKYKAETEREAMLLAKEELGSEALILSIKSIKPKGILKWFQKPYVEVTAAIEEAILERKEMESKKQETLMSSSEKELEQFKTFLSQFSQKQVSQEKEVNQKLKDFYEKPKEIKLKQEVESTSNHLNNDKQDENTLVGQVIYEQLLENEVDSNLADKLTADLIQKNKKASLEESLNIVYRQLVKELSEVNPISVEGKTPKSIFFIGSTGVGKTTTIAKLASFFTLEKKCKVALITADTYRIAAVEQLKTYANILGIPIRVIYKEDEILECIQEFQDMDLIFIDTAGRSYQDTKHLAELKQLLETVEEKMVYLVLSLSTKNSDLKKTVSAYDFTDFSMIFTKLDETLAYGSILNIKYQTGKALSYITTGQNVPEDIAELDPQEIASKILGGVNS